MEGLSGRLAAVEKGLESRPNEAAGRRQRGGRVRVDLRNGLREPMLEKAT